MITLHDPTKEEFLATAKVGEEIQFLLNLEGQEFEIVKTAQTEADFDDLYKAFTHAKARTLREFYTKFYLNRIQESADWSSSATALCYGVVEHIKKHFPSGNLALLLSAVTYAVEKEKAETLNR